MVIYVAALSTYIFMSYINWVQIMHMNRMQVYILVNGVQVNYN